MTAEDAERRKAEIFSYPYYYTEDGRKRYINVGDIRDNRLCQYEVFDEYGRKLEDYWYGELVKTVYNDKKHTAFYLAIDPYAEKVTKENRPMYEWEYIENYWKPDE